jgi:hypothetical protein
LAVIWPRDWIACSSEVSVAEPRNHSGAREGRDGGDDLAGVDLSSLDLEGIDLEDHPSPVWRWIGLAVLVGMGALVLWLPTTDWFRLTGHDSGPFFALTAAGVIIGILLGRWLWRWAMAAAERYAARAAERERHEPEGPPSPWLRRLTLLAVVGGAAAILYFSGSAYNQEGERYQSLWFAVAAGAIVVGILLGRWLLMQAAARTAATGERPKIVLPPWFKWVTLGILGGTGVIVLVAKIASGAEAGAFDFPLGAAGFVAGVGGAIWLARRFEEWERRNEAKMALRQEGGDSKPK